MKLDQILDSLSEEDKNAILNMDVESLSTDGVRKLQSNKTVFSKFRTLAKEQGKTDALEMKVSDVFKEEGAKLPTFVRGAASAFQGPTFEFGDEIFGGGAKALGKDYKKFRDMYRGAATSFAEENPITSLASQILLSLPVGGVAPRVGMVARNPTISSIGTGAGFGAASGIGGSEQKTLSGIAKDAGKGAAFGGALSPVASQAGRLTSAAFSPITSRISSSGNIPRGPVEKTGDFLFGGDLAGRSVLRQIKRDEMTVDDVLNELAGRTSEGRFGISGGENLRQLLDRQATLPGTTKNQVEQAIQDLQKTRGSRLREATQKELNPDQKQFTEVQEFLEQEKLSKSAPYYEKLRNIEIDTDDKDVNNILSRAKEIGLFKNAKKAALLENRPFTLVDETGAFSKKASMEDLDTLKQTLDDQIELLISKEQNADARRTTAFKNELVDLLDRKTIDKETGESIYKKARDEYAGPAALQSAAETGQFVARQSRSKIEKAKNDLSSASELEAFRLGVYDTLRDEFGTPGKQTQVLNMWKNDTLREKLEVLFPTEESFIRFTQKVEAEAKDKGLESVGRGSKTAQTLLGVEDDAQEYVRDMANILINTKAGNAPGLIEQFNRFRRTIPLPESVRNEIGEILLSKKGDAKAIGERLKKLAEQMEKEQTRGAVRSGMIGQINPLEGLF